MREAQVRLCKERQPEVGVYLMKLDNELTSPGDDTSDHIASVYLGQLGGTRQQERARRRIDWTVAEARGPRVLDVGCSQGITALLLARQGLSVLGLDIRTNAIEYASSLLASESSDACGRVDF